MIIYNYQQKQIKYRSNMKKYTKKGWEKRKKEREGLPEFFKKHIEIIRDQGIRCEECGGRLQGDVSEVAHILPKQKFKSICTSDKNVVYLCGWKSDNNCHSKFDEGTNENVKKMNIFPKITERFRELEEIITEKYNYKLLDRYTHG